MAQPAGNHQPFQINGIDVITSRGIVPFAEGLDWFPIPQGGFYSKDSLQYGLRIGDSPAKEEFLNDRTLITRLSNRQPDDPTKKTQFKPRLEAVKNALSTRNPIGIIISNKHPCLAAEIKKRLTKSRSHALLGGWWLLTDHWIIRDGVDEVLMGRYDKCDMKNIWWTTNVSDPTSLTASPAPSTATTCLSCRQTCWTRFRRGLLCDNEGCPSRRSAMTGTDQDDSPYLDAYLSWRPQMDNIATPRFVYVPGGQPQIRNKQELQALKDSKECRRPLWSGFVCKQCNSMNCYFRWGQLKCRTCKHSEPSPISPINFDDLMDTEYMDLDDDSEIPNVTVVQGGAEEILPRVKHKDYVIRRWKLSESGQVGLVVPKKHVIDAPGGPRDTHRQLWDALNDSSLTYKRFRLKRSVVKGQRTRWMGQNIGEPYAAVMRMKESNLALDAAPDVIKSVLHRLNTLSHSLFGRDPQFNEILCMASLPDMKMEWHDDGEDVIVGDVVMSEQLGSTGMMSFGLKPRYYSGKTSNNKIHYDDPVMRGAAKEGARADLKSKLDRQLITYDDYKVQLTHLLADVSFPPSPHRCLTFPLPGNGSFMFQHGIDVNKYWEHRVENVGLVLFVNTARTLRASPQTPGQPGDDDGDDSDSSESRTSEEGDARRKSKRKRTASASATQQRGKGDKKSPEPPAKRQPHCWWELGIARDNRATASSTYA